MFRQMLTRLGVPAVVAAVFLMAVLLMAYEIRAAGRRTAATSRRPKMWPLLREPT